MFAKLYRYPNKYDDHFKWIAYYTKCLKNARGAKNYYYFHRFIDDHIQMHENCLTQLEKCVIIYKCPN